MAKLIDKLYNRLIEGKLVLEEGDDASAVTGDKPTVYKIGASTDVTTMFDKVKVGDMINQNDEILYIVGGSNYENGISLFVVDYGNDKIGYWYYEKENNNWVINEDTSCNKKVNLDLNFTSFDINKSSLGGTKLYLHELQFNNEAYGTKLFVVSTDSSKINCSSVNNFNSTINKSKIIRAYTTGLYAFDNVISFNYVGSSYFINCVKNDGTIQSISLVTNETEDIVTEL